MRSPESSPEWILSTSSLNPRQRLLHNVHSHAVSEPANESSGDCVALALEVWFGRVLGPGSKKRQRGNC
jgi:hypothetical protein